MPRDGQIACDEARGSGWVPLSPPPYPVNAQGRANCRYRGQPRAKEDEREREREKERERERDGGARMGEGMSTTGGSVPWVTMAHTLGVPSIEIT